MSFQGKTSLTDAVVTEYTVAETVALCVALCVATLKSAVINSGTASLESALIGTPQVVGWSTSPLTYFIGKDLLRVMDHIKFISLGNLCLDRLAFKEFIQKDFTSDAILNETRRIIEDEEYRSGMIQDYADIRESLGGAGASRRVARRMVSILSGAED